MCCENIGYLGEWFVEGWVPTNMEVANVIRAIRFSPSEFEFTEDSIWKRVEELELDIVDIEYKILLEDMVYNNIHDEVS